MNPAVVELVTRTRAEQGLPPGIEDPAFLYDLAGKVLAATREDAHSTK